MILSAVAERDAEEAAHSSTKELGEECDDVGNDVERVWFVGENAEAGNEIFTVWRKT